MAILRRTFYVEWTPEDPVISKKLQPFGTTIFAEMTRLAGEHEAINLSQGFPDFEGPPEILEAAVAALRDGHNQYPRSMGVLPLVEAIAEHQRRFYGLEHDPLSEVTVFCGATEGIAASILGLLDPGDEVVLFEPFYDSYPACVAMAGGTPRYCTLRFPDFALDLDELAGAFGDRTRLVVLNTPHNPTGKVFTREELEAVADLCRRHDALVLTDEVYEHLTYDGAEHVPMATLTGMRDRTLTLSSAGKTFSYTGWKVGWATGPAPLVAAAQAAHQFLTFTTPAVLQLAVAEGLRSHTGAYLEELRSSYQEQRDYLVDVLREVGFRVAVPRGTYFVLADFTRLCNDNDLSFVQHMVKEHRVAAIPPSPFYEKRPEEGRRLVRFAFCKRMATLEAAAQRLRGLRGRDG
jgi:N-succinyldiaminopimelate aminotransferase